MIKYSHLVCPSGCGSHMKVAIAKTRVIVECQYCLNRMSIPVKEYDRGPDKESWWNYIKYSVIYDVVD